MDLIAAFGQRTAKTEYLRLDIMLCTICIKLGEIIYQCYRWLQSTPEISESEWIFLTSTSKHLSRIPERNLIINSLHVTVANHGKSLAQHRILNFRSSLLIPPIFLFPILPPIYPSITPDSCPPLWPGFASTGNSDLLQVWSSYTSYCLDVTLWKRLLRNVALCKRMQRGVPLLAVVCSTPTSTRY